MLRENPSVISPPMTMALALYSAVFMRFAWVIHPRNMLLFSCHATNEALQLIQAWRSFQYRTKMKK
jgi:hypothetical protein